MPLYDEFETAISGLDKRLGALEKKLSDLTQTITRELSKRPDASAFARLEKAFQDLDQEKRGLYSPTGSISTLQKTVERLAKDLADVRLEAKAASDHSNLLNFAYDHPELTFNVVKVGCGLAGYREADMIPMFLGAPENVNLPEGWRK